MKVRFILFFLFIILLSSCVNDISEVALLSKKKDGYPVLSGKQANIEFRDSGLVRLRVQAGILKKFEVEVKEPYYLMDSGLKIIFFDKNGIEVSTLSARSGVFYEHSKKAEVKYKVVVTNKEGKRLETEKLIWQEKDSIRNEGEVYLYENQRRLRGKKLIATNDFSHMELENFEIQIPIDEVENENK